MGNKPPIFLIIVATIALLSFIVINMKAPSKAISQQTPQLGYVNISSVTLNYENVTSFKHPPLNQSTLSKVYPTLPSNTTTMQGVNVSPGASVSIMVTTVYTFNGQAIQFIAETPGFSVLNSTYLYNSTTYMPAGSANANETATVVPPGQLVGYTINLHTPSRGYQGNLDIVAVINNVDQSKVIVTNGA